nr:DNA-directed DNA polymerase [Tanacetum cinerariifolium]
MVRPNGQAPRMMEELCQPSINGRGGSIAPIPIQATDFHLRHHMIQQVQNTCQFHGLSGDDASRHIDKFLEITQHMKQNEVSDDTLCLSLFPYSLTHHAIHMFMKMNTASSSGMGSLPSNTVPNPREDLKSITTQSGITLAGSSVFPPHLPSKEVDRELEMITNQVLTGSTNNVPPLVVHPSPASTSSTTFLLLRCPRKLHFELSFADALLHMPKFALMFKSLLNNKEKFFDLATTLLYLPELTSTQMILELADRSTTRPAGIAEVVFVKVGKFHFLTDFVVVDYVVDPRVSLILVRPFLRTGRALIDVYGEELTLRVYDEAITFKVGQTLKYSYNDAESINRVDVIDVACEEYVQEVLGFSDNSKSGNPIPTSDPIIALSSPSLSPFEEGNFILEEIEAFLTSKLILPGINDTDHDLKGDIHLLEELLNNDPSLSPIPPKELNVEEIKTIKSSIDEPPELKLKELPSHLEYSFLEGIDKLHVIISKELKVEEKSALLKILKSHKRAIA